MPHAFYFSAWKYNISRYIDGGYIWNPGILYYITAYGFVYGIPKNATLEQFKSVFGKVNNTPEYTTKALFTMSCFAKSLGIMDSIEALNTKYGRDGLNTMPSFEEFKRALNVDVYKMPSVIELNFTSNNIVRTYTQKGELSSGKNTLTTSSTSDSGYTFSGMYGESFFQSASAGNYVAWRDGEANWTTNALYPNNDRLEIITSACTEIKNNKFTSIYQRHSDAPQSCPMAKVICWSDPYYPSSCVMFTDPAWTGVRAATYSSCGVVREFKFRQNVSRTYHGRVKYTYENYIVSQTKV